MIIRPTLKSPRLRKSWCNGEYRYHHETGVLGALVLVAKLARRVRKRGRRLVVHIQAPVLGFLAVPLRLLVPGLVLVASQHTDWRFLKAHQRTGLWLLATLSKRYITCGRAVSKTMPHRVRRRLERDQRLRSIPNGIDPRQLATYDSIAESREATDESSEVVAVVAARMVPAKNCPFIPQLLKECEAIDKLIWYGDGPERAGLEREITRLGVEQRIELRGQRPREEVLAALAGGTLYISASRWEGLSVADLEAAALGCWPFMSDIIQRQELVETLGIPLYPLTDLGAWIEGIRRFLDLPAPMRRDMRRALSGKARTHFDLDRMVSSYLAAYTSVSAPP